MVPPLCCREPIHGRCTAEHVAKLVHPLSDSRLAHWTILAARPLPIPSPASIFGERFQAPPPPRSSPAPAEAGSMIRVTTTTPYAGTRAPAGAVGIGTERGRERRLPRCDSTSPACPCRFVPRSSPLNPAPRDQAAVPGRVDCRRFRVLDFFRRRRDPPTPSAGGAAGVRSRPRHQHPADGGGSGVAGRVGRPPGHFSPSVLPSWLPFLPFWLPFYRVGMQATYPDVGSCKVAETL
jgi:hypothetical protein